METKDLYTYLCGGIQGLNDAQCHDWREYAKEKLVTGTLDPMVRDYRGTGLTHMKEIVELDIEDIKNSTYLLVNASKPSWGTSMEIIYAAIIYRKTVVAFTGKGVEPSPWLAYHTQLYENIDDAIAFINRAAETTVEYSNYGNGQPVTK